MLYYQRPNCFSAMLMLGRFLQEICLPGAIVQFGEKNNIIAYADTINPEEWDLSSHSDKDLYFMGGVDPKLELRRATNDDIVSKNYFYFDIDLRKKNPELTPEDIKFVIKTYYIPALAETKFKDWRYIVFTGNGIHIYFFSKDGKKVENKLLWKLGMKALIRELLIQFPGDPVDPSCVNLARLARLPGTFNQKSSPPTPVTIEAFQDCYTSLLDTMEETGSAEQVRILKEAEEKMKQMQIEYGNSPEDNYSRICNIPIEQVVIKSMGLDYKGRHFFVPGSTNKSAFFKSEKGNFIIHGGTGRIPAIRDAFFPFELLKAVKNFTNAETFTWFKKEFPEVLSPPASIIAPPNLSSGNFREVLEKLQDLTFDPLALHPALDNARPVIRGTVTRVGASSYTGKSCLAYFMVHKLIKNGHRGMFFSTEVPAPIVLANILKIELQKTDIWQVRDALPNIDLNVQMEYFDNLSIFDVQETRNSLRNIEEIIKNAILKHPDKPPSFCVIDYCQMVMPKIVSGSPFDNMSRYAFETQEIAQKYNISVIDLSQVTDLQDSQEKIGHISFKMSKDLYNAADIAILLKRDREKGSIDSRSLLDIRKHKYIEILPPPIYMQYKTHGDFEILENQDKNTISY